MTNHEKVQQLLRVKDGAPLTFDPHASALVVVDVQRYFCSPDYPFAHVLEKLVPGVTAGYFERVRSGVLDNIARLAPRIDPTEGCD
jgi:nicotinamidase-related amidase